VVADPDLHLRAAGARGAVLGAGHLMREGVLTDVAGLIVFVLICLIAAAVGGKATVGSVRTWYPGLRKPAWNPPARLFGPVWSVLYLMMAFAAWRVWLTRDATEVRSELGLFGAQLVLNVLWSVVFFGLRRPGLALLDIAILVCFARRVGGGGHAIMGHQRSIGLSPIALVSGPNRANRRREIVGTVQLRDATHLP